MVWIIIFTVLALIVMGFILYKRSKITATKKTDKSLASFKTYAFLPQSSITWPSKEKSAMDDVSETVVHTVNKNMLNLGYDLDLERPDLLVVLKTNSVLSKPPIYAHFPYSGTMPINPVYQAYSYTHYQLYNEIKRDELKFSEPYKVWLTIDIVERQTKQVVWTASTNETVYLKKSSEEIVEYLNEMFRQYPVQQ